MQYNYSKWWSFFDKQDGWIEEKRSFMKELKEKAREEFIPINIHMSAFWNNSIHKDRRMHIHLNDSWDNKKFAKSFIKKSNIQRLLQWYDKVPNKSDIIDSLSILFDTCLLPNIFQFTWLTEDKLKETINDYMDGRITYEQYRSVFDLSKLNDKKMQEMYSPSSGWYTWTRMDRLVTVGKKRMDENLKLIRSKIKPVDKVSYEENFRTWKRINRGFMNGTSYKPLKSKTVEEIKKKKLFVIIDCSWSMWSSNGEGEPSREAISFAWACFNSGLFDMKYVILHASEWWRNIQPELAKWQLVSFHWGWEWFEVLQDNLEREWIKGCDYTVVLTDLCIWADAEQWLYNYIKWTKHIILSFQNSWTLKGMNVRTVKTNKDIINSLFTLVWR